MGISGGFAEPVFSERAVNRSQSMVMAFFFAMKNEFYKRLSIRWILGFLSRFKTDSAFSAND